MTENPDTAVVMCDSVKGLGITLDPSHYTFGPHSGVNYEQVMKHVFHVRLRDTTKDQLQVRVGQGDIEYGRLVNQLHKVHYDRACASTCSPPRRWISLPRCERCGCCWKACCRVAGDGWWVVGIRLYPFSRRVHAAKMRAL